MTTVDDILLHFGVKGMKWGQRKSDSGGMTGPHPIVVTQKKAGGKVTVSGGKGHEATDDALVSRALAQKAKKSGIHSLSNQELQALTTRMNLEQQFSRLQPPSAKKAVLKFTSDIVLQVGKQQITKLASDALSKQIATALAAKK